MRTKNCRNTDHDSCKSWFWCGCPCHTAGAEGGEDVGYQLAASADALLAMLTDTIGVVLNNPARVAAARAAIAAAAASDARLRTIVEEMQGTLNTDGVLIVVMDDVKARVVIMSGGAVITSDVVDARNETPAGHSYCKYCVANRGVFVVEDAMTTPALRGNPYIDLVRGYVGAVLVVNNCAVGALCVTTDRPRFWTEAEVAVVAARARDVSAILEAAFLAMRA